MGTRHLWIILNSVLIALAIRGGYVSLSPERLRHANPEPILCLIIPLVVTLFSILAVAYSVRRWKSSDPLLRPSLTRNPLNWWGDPLQSLFISMCAFIAAAVGAALRRPSFGSVGFWALGVYACFGIGLFVGQALVYRIYRQHIASS